MMDDRDVEYDLKNFNGEIKDRNCQPCRDFTMVDRSTSQGFRFGLDLSSSFLRDLSDAATGTSPAEIWVRTVSSFTFNSLIHQKLCYIKQNPVG